MLVQTHEREPKVGLPCVSLRIESD
jgi:hypothetical protein